MYTFSNWVVFICYRQPMRGICLKEQSFIWTNLYILKSRKSPWRSQLRELQ